MHFLVLWQFTLLITWFFHILKCFNLLHLLLYAWLFSRAQHLDLFLMYFLTKFRDSRLESVYILLVLSLIPNFISKLGLPLLFPFLVSFLKISLVDVTHNLLLMVYFWLKTAFFSIFGFNWNFIYFLFFIPF
jgi:hypothetical protein